jgi:hypothetical protein
VRAGFFDTQREAWVDLDGLCPEARPAPSLPATCTCGAHFKKGETNGLREHRRLCASAPDVGAPEPTRLGRHVKRYGRDGAEPWLDLLEPAA